VTPVTLIVTGPPSRVVTPVIVTGSSRWFGGQSWRTLGVAPLQSGGLAMQTPARQTPPSQGVPSAAGGLVQTPATGSHTPAT
jgi:hypothetical protein